MMRMCLAALVGALVLSAAGAGCSKTDQGKDAVSRPIFEDTVSGTLSAKLKDVDPVTRVITLQDEKGNEETFVAGPSVTRLDEMKPGDTVKVEFTAKTTAELRPPTPEERQTPIAFANVPERNPSSEPPGARVARTLRLVTTVEAVDVPNMRVTLRGPLGDLAVVQGRKAENIKKLHVGDTIVITYADATVVSLKSGT
jgi:hypothetical protein